MNKLKNLLVLMCACCALNLGAVQLPEIIGDNMVLQQQSNAKLWGWSAPGAMVKVTPSWSKKAYTAKADESGRWDVAVATPKGSYTPYSITFKDSEGTVSINDVLVGEVWFASGQSNMEMPLNGFWCQPIEGSNEAIAYSGQYKGLRMATIEKTASQSAKDQVKGVWKKSCPENAQWFSAVGYFFAEALTKMLDVPVGIINCSWGGSLVECWVPREDLVQYKDVDLNKSVDPKEIPTRQPYVMYNGMVKPLIGYTIKGFIWNQGESNVGRHDSYPLILATMVNVWREKWGNDSLPFYQVEIPPFSYGNVNADNAAFLRESQHKSVKIIPNSGIVCTSDLVYPYETEDIHAAKKQPIGERLAYLAAAKTYGMKGIACESPAFESMKIDGARVILHFTNAPDGFTPNHDLEGFEVAGADGKFYPAKAGEDWGARTIILTCEQVPQIEKVRYCFKNWAIGKVHNLRGLPLIPFQADVKK